MFYFSIATITVIKFGKSRIIELIKWQNSSDAFLPLEIIKKKLHNVPPPWNDEKNCFIIIIKLGRPTPLDWRDHKAN